MKIKNRNNNKSNYDIKIDISHNAGPAQDNNVLIHDNEETHESNNTFKILISIILISLVVLMIIPVYNIKVDPNPQHIERIEIPFNLTSGIEHQRLNSIEEINSIPLSSLIRNLAVKIISNSNCHGSRTCEAKALYYYVKDYYNYVKDPPYEYIQSPDETLISGGGDCEDLALLLSELLTAVNIHNRIVIVPNHAYNQVWISEARKSYKDNEGWINLDTTCKSCLFGQIPRNYERKSYIKIN